jgi:hypothetical protein
MLGLLKGSGKENLLGLLPDEVRLCHRDAVHQDLLDEQQNQDEQHRGDYPPWVDAHPDELGDLQEDAGLLPRRLKRMDCYLREVGAGLHLQLAQGLELQMDYCQGAVALEAQHRFEGFRPLQRLPESPVALVLLEDEEPPKQVPSIQPRCRVDYGCSHQVARWRHLSQPG